MLADDGELEESKNMLEVHAVYSGATCVLLQSNKSLDLLQVSVY